MPEQNPTAPSGPLTVDSAAQYFAGLLSQAPEDVDPLREEEADLEEIEGREPSTEEQLDADEAEQLQRLEAQEAAEADAAAKQEAEQRQQSFKVKVADEELDVTLDELLKGYSRTADYTRKTQALAEQRRTVDSEMTTLREQRQQYAQGLEQLQTALQAATPQEPDWDRVRAEYPDEFSNLWATWQNHNRRLAAVQAERERVAAEEARDQFAAYERHKAEEQVKLLDAIPEWKDETVALTERRQLVEFARSVGFTDQEIAGVTDHRAVVLLRTAMKFAEAQRKQPEIKARVEKVKAATPGGATPSRKTANQERVDKARAKLAQTGSVSAAADFFTSLLG